MTPAGAEGAAMEGSCLCGGVSYTVTAAVDTLTICHCGQCRRANGSAFQPVIVVPVDAVAFADRSTIAEYRSSPGKLRAFCRECGAPVYSRRDDRPALYRLRAGLIADLPAPAHIEQQHRADAWPWLDRVAALIARPVDGGQAA